MRELPVTPAGGLAAYMLVESCSHDHTSKYNAIIRMQPIIACFILAIVVAVRTGQREYKKK